jgi:hypothetical protein
MDTILSSLLLTSSQLDECLEKGHSLEAAASSRSMRQHDDGGSGREEGPGGTGDVGQPGSLDQVKGQQMSPMVPLAGTRTRSPSRSSLGQKSMAVNSRQQSPQPQITKCAADAAFSWAQIAKDHLARRRSSAFDAARELSSEQAFGRVASPKSPANRSVDRGMQDAKESGQVGRGGVGGGSLYVRTSYADVSREEAQQRRERRSMSPASRSAERHWAPSALANTRDSPTSRPSPKGNSSSPLGSRIRGGGGGGGGGGDDGGGGGAQTNGPGGGKRGGQGEAEDLSSEELQVAIRRWQRQESLSRAAMPQSTRTAPSSTTTHTTSPRIRPASSQVPPQRRAEHAPAQAGTPAMTAAVMAVQERSDVLESSISRKASSSFSFDGADGHESSSSPDSRAARSAPLSHFGLHSPIFAQTKQATSSVEAKEIGGGRGGGGEGGEGGGAERRTGSGGGDRVQPHVSAGVLPNTPLPLSLLSLFRATLSAHAASAEAPQVFGGIKQSGTGFVPSGKSWIMCVCVCHVCVMCVCVCMCVCVSFRARR